MSDMTTMEWQSGDDGVVVLTIDVAGRTMNVMTPEFLDDIATAAAGIAADDAIRGAVITSGKEAFMAGADLHALVADFGSRDSRELYVRCRRLQDALRQLETCGKPVAAAINGSALGGGLELCLACHYRVAADKQRSVLGLPEVQVGLMPGGGGTQRLPRMLGIEPALKLITEGTRLSPADALAAGIVNELAAAGREIDAARRWVLQHGDATQPWDRQGFKVPGGAGLMDPRVVQTFTVGTALLNQATQHNYPAPAAILSAVYEGTVLPIDKALDIETAYFVSLLRSPVFRNMARTLFISKGAADKLERRPAGPPERKVTKLGVLGAGMMGAGIAYVSARAGIEVVLLDTDDA
ncbi:MAG TPA: enoyl-CoA hydratase-related protein, partial [Woeseiaceae bacterium]|nr:enoyl-CoA hydratase-related protein [Woeseiaceae bacterium]